MSGSVELASAFDHASGERLAAAERLVVTFPQLFGGALRECDLAYRLSSRFFVVVVRLETDGTVAKARARLEFWTARAGGRATSLAALSESDRAGFLYRVELCDVKVKGLPPLGVADAMRRVMHEAGHEDRHPAPSPRPTLLVDSSGPGWTGVFWEAASSRLFIPGTIAPPPGDEFALAVRLPEVQRPVETRVRVVEVRRKEQASAGAPAGFFLALLSAPAGLAEALARATPESADEHLRGAPRYPVKAPVRVSGAPPHPGPLPEGEGGSGASAPAAVTHSARIEYATEQQLAADWVDNLSQGGAFVRTSRPSPVGTEVTLELSLPGGVELAAPSRVVQVTELGMAVKFKLDPEAEAALAGAIAHFSARPRRALLVDDDALVRRMICDALVERGFEVVTAADGEGGLRALSDELLRLDLLVTDVRMPGMDGETFVRTIRRLGGEGELAIVAVTGLLEPGQEKRLEEAGADAVLEKALGPELIAQAADAVLERKRLVASGQ